MYTNNLNEPQTYMCTYVYGYAPNVAEKKTITVCISNGNGPGGHRWEANCQRVFTFVTRRGSQMGVQYARAASSRRGTWLSIWKKITFFIILGKPRTCDFVCRYTYVIQYIHRKNNGWKCNQYLEYYEYHKYSKSVNITASFDRTRLQVIINL